MIWRVLNLQGIAGVAVAAALAILLVIAKIDARHWHKQADQNGQLYRAEQEAFATTTANYRAAADQARRDDAANVARVAARQSEISERTANDFETRIAAARADAGRLRTNAASAGDPGPGGSAPMPRLPASAGGVAQAAREDRLSPSDALTATEQAIQLDELIKWVRAQGQVDNNVVGGTISPH